MIPIKPALHQICRELEKRPVVTWMQYGRASDMVANVERGVVNPLGGFEIQRMRAQNLVETRNFRQPHTQTCNEIPEIGRRTIEDRQRADGEADVWIGVLGLQESRVQGRQMLHDYDFAGQ